MKTVQARKGSRLVYQRMEDRGSWRARITPDLAAFIEALGIGERKKIAERYGQGETMAELARDYDVGEATIHRAIHGR